MAGTVTARVGDAVALSLARLLAPSATCSAVALFVLPLVWWAPFYIAAPVIVLAAFLLVASIGVSKSTPAATTTDRQVVLIVSGGAVLAALVAFAWDAVSATRVLVAGFVVTRTLMLSPTVRGSRLWLTGAHMSAGVLSLAALGNGVLAIACAMGGALLLLDLITPPAHERAADALPTPANDHTPSLEATATAPSAPAPLAPTIRNAATLAASFAAGLVLLFVPYLTIAVRDEIAEDPVAQLSPEQVEQEWRERFPWLYAPGERQQAAIEAPTGVCADAEVHEQRELHVLLEPLHPEDASDYRSIADQFPRPLLTPADAASADAVFGAPCANSPNLRQIQGAALAPAPGVDVAIADTPVAVGAVYTFSNAPGALLLARASTSAGYVLIAAKHFGDENRIWIVSTQGSAGYGGRLFMIGRDEAETPLLWYGALDGDGGSAEVDIIDLSALAPRNSGAIRALGASRCGQTLGDYLQPAEPNCAERPAWAFWLVDAHYTSPARNEVDVVWNLRRQFGVAGEPARYEPAFDTLMQGTYVRDDAGWRLVRVTNPEVAGLGDQLAMAN